MEAHETIRVRIAAVHALTPRIRSFELLPQPGQVLPPFRAGDHVDVLRADRLKRSYSLANDPAEAGRYVLGVLREPDGAMSGWLHDGVAVGDELTISAPKSAFRLDEMGDHHLLIAGGVGITPLKAMAHRLLATGKDFRLVYCTRSAEETAFLSDLRDLLGDRLTLHHDGGDPARGLDVAELLRKRAPGGHVYVCGPRGLIDAVRAAARHWPTGTVHFEIFASPGREPAADGDAPFEIELRRSGAVIAVPPGKSALDAILEAGHDVPFVCKEGWCGNCQCDLLDGVADHRDEILTPAERTANTLIHLCVSRAAPGVARLVIDR